MPTAAPFSAASPCAMVAFPTMGLVLQFGWLGETEAINTLVVAGSLIVWRWADTTGKSPLAGGAAATAWAALGMLTKGPQAPVYFLGGVAIFCWPRAAGELLRWQHAAGVGLFLAIWLAWEIPFYLRVGPNDAWTMLTGDIGMRFHGRQLDADLEACCRVPPERHGLHVALVRAAAGLSATRLPPQYCVRSRGRSVSRLVDRICRAELLSRAGGAEPLSGADPALGRAADRPGGPAVLRGHRERVAGRLRRHFFIGMGLVAAGLGLWVVVATACDWDPCVASSRWHLRSYLPWRPWLRWRRFWASARPEPWRQRLGTLTVGAFVGPELHRRDHQHLRRHAAPHRRRDRRGRGGVPDGVQLVSIGPVDDVFLYYYGKPIKRLPASEGLGHKQPPWTYFCMGCGPNMPAFDMPYEKLGVISTEAAYSDHPHDIVIVGRRLSESTAEETKSSVR